ncbi:MAG: hypothetical protein GY868_20860 [Deltaproteobacteria bacterium]|nr:hypothetical protein [Deltaproteobacteria bacterium]
MIKTSIFVFSFSMLIAVGAQADTIFFKNGTRLDIDKVWEQDDMVLCELYGQVVSYPKPSIERVERTPPTAAPQPESPPEKDPATADTLFSRARNLAASRAWPDAIELGHTALIISKSPEIIRAALAGWHNNFAAELRQNGSLDQARFNLEKALEHAPQNRRIAANLCEVYLDLAAAALTKRNHPDCRSYSVRAAHLCPDNPRRHLLEGKLAYENGRYDQALTSWQTTLRISPQHLEARMLLNKLQQDRSVEGAFSSAATGNFTLKFLKQKNSALADDVGAILQQAYNDIGRDVDLYPNGAIQVIIYPRSSRNQLTYFPDWAAGIYDGKIRIGEDLWHRRTYLRAVLYHEYTHALVHIISGNTAPLWLNEGLAEYEARRFHSAAKRRQRRQLLAEATGQNKLLPIAQLNSMSLAAMSRMSPQMIPLVYAQSESFVTFLIERYCLYDLVHILRLLGTGTSLQDALQTVFYDNLHTLESEWREKLRQSVKR